ncbi:hypothetical protein [Nitratidesulfovibrio vulgaris]|uniref:hypothetical protein n=1 Tax=Nitratidesulfovibrio vulgaris TaxID=881 RepID=UPI0023005950|nr:hypothetical protein [Nitratidesulfovibrio vulgaris]WCB47635.1 hypothetical protein PH214_06010 [Nitratidesulfovibrio vulgaris]
MSYHHPNYHETAGAGRCLSGRVCLSILLLVAFVTSGLVAGCSSTPVPVKFAGQEQRTLRSVQHWRALADEVAGEVAKAMDDLMYTGLVSRPIHVVRHGGTAFGLFFHDLVQTALVRRGLQVSREAEADSMYLDYDVRMVLHDGRYASVLGPVDAGLPAGLGAVALSLVADPYDSRSRNEVLVVSSLWYNNRYIFKSADPFYIHDADWQFYRNGQPQGGSASPALVDVHVQGTQRRAVQPD